MSEQAHARSRLRPVLGIVALLAALAALWLLVLVPLMSGDTEPAAAPTVAATPVDPAPSAGPDTRALQEPEQLPVETFQVFLSRDPFRPVQPDPDGNGGPAPSPGATPSPGASPGTSPGGCVGDAEVVCDGRVVTLVDVFEDDAGLPTAVIQVDSTLYTVHEGDTFAQNFRVLSIDPPCVTLIFGDDSFTLCEGEQVLK